MTNVGDEFLQQVTCGETHVTGGGSVRTAEPGILQDVFVDHQADLMLRISRTQKALRKPAGIEAKKALAQRQPLYKTELAQMETQFSKTIKAIKKDLPSHWEEKKKLTKEIFDQMIRDLTKGGEAAKILAVTKEEIIESIISRLDGLDIAEEDKDTLRKALLPVFSGNGVRDG